jgi:hypothetical protein
VSHTTHYVTTPDLDLDAEHGALVLAPEGSTVTPTGRCMSPEGVDLGEARLVLEVPRTPREQLREFVYDLVDGRVLTSEQVEESVVGMVFMPLTFGALSPPEVLEEQPDLVLPPQPALLKVFVERALPKPPTPPTPEAVPAKLREDYEWGAIDKEDYDEAVAAINARNDAAHAEWERTTHAEWVRDLAETKASNAAGKQAHARSIEAHEAAVTAWAQECARLRTEHEARLTAWEDVRKRVLRWWARDLGVVYEQVSKAGPRGINGYPIFMSLRLMHREDWKLAFNAYRKEVERRKADDDLFGENSP